MKLAFIIIGIVYLFTSIIFVFGPEIKRAIKYKKHKKLVAKCLYDLAKKHDNLLINNFEIKYGESYITFDHIYFGNKYIYCLKDERYKYGIQGDGQDTKWFDYNNKKSFEFVKNNLQTNTSQVLALKKYLNIAGDEQFFFSIVCINDNCDLAIKNCKPYEIVINLKNLKKFILSKEKDKSVGTINQNLLENTVKVLYQQCQQDLRN